MLLLFSTLRALACDTKNFKALALQKLKVKGVKALFFIAISDIVTIYKDHYKTYVEKQHFLLSIKKVTM